MTPRLRHTLAVWREHRRRALNITMYNQYFRLGRYAPDPRKQVHCWVCGWSARRKPTELTGVVGRDTKVQSHGPCGNPEREWCDGRMLTDADCRFVVKAAVEYDNQGRNRTSEYDL